MAKKSKTQRAKASAARAARKEQRAALEAEAKKAEPAAAAETEAPKRKLFAKADKGDGSASDGKQSMSQGKSAEKKAAKKARKKEPLEFSQGRSSGDEARDLADQAGCAALERGRGCGAAVLRRVRGRARQRRHHAAAGCYLRFGGVGYGEEMVRPAHLLGLREQGQEEPRDAHRDHGACEQRVRHRDSHRNGDGDQEGGRRVESEKKVFPATCWCAWSLTTAVGLRCATLRASRAFVGADGNPAPLTRAEYNKIMKRTDKAKDKKSVVSASLEVGQSVKVVSGPPCGVRRRGVRGVARRRQGEGHGFHLRPRDAGRAFVRSGGQDLRVRSHRHADAPEWTGASRDSMAVADRYRVRSS